jgi:hypothetical protein
MTTLFALDLAWLSHPVTRLITLSPRHMVMVFVGQFDRHALVEVDLATRRAYPPYGRMQPHIVVFTHVGYFSRVLSNRLYFNSDD